MTRPTVAAAGLVQFLPELRDLLSGGLDVLCGASRRLAQLFELQPQVVNAGVGIPGFAGPGRQRFPHCCQFLLQPGQFPGVCLAVPVRLAQCVYLGAKFFALLDGSPLGLLRLLDLCGHCLAAPGRGVELAFQIGKFGFRPAGGGGGLIPLADRRIELPGDAVQLRIECLYFPALQGGGLAG